MKYLAFVPTLLLAGCAIHGSWLDDIGKPPRPPVAMSSEQAVQLAQEAAQLRARADTVRGQLAQETDRRQRLRYYEELRDLGDQLVPLERALMEAGRPARMPAHPPATGPSAAA
jgi:hypothetical protein